MSEFKNKDYIAHRVVITEARCKDSSPEYRVHEPLIVNKVIEWIDVTGEASGLGYGRHINSYLNHQFCTPCREGGWEIYVNENGMGVHYSAELLCIKEAEERKMNEIIEKARYKLIIWPEDAGYNLIYTLGPDGAHTARTEAKHEVLGTELGLDDYDGFMAMDSTSSFGFDHTYYVYLDTDKKPIDGLTESEVETYFAELANKKTEAKAKAEPKKDILDNSGTILNIIEPKEQSTDPDKVFEVIDVQRAELESYLSNLGGFLVTYSLDGSKGYTQIHQIPRSTNKASIVHSINWSLNGFYVVSERTLAETIEGYSFEDDGDSNWRMMHFKEKRDAMNFALNRVEEIKND